MAVTNATVRRYLLDKGTRKTLSTGNQYLKNTATNAKGFEETTRPSTIRIGSKKPGLGFDIRADRWAGTANIIASGFYSNYLDDVTVGFGKGFGNHQFHNYMAKKYEPTTYDKLTENFWYRLLGNLNAGVEGAKDAAVEYQSFYDGFIGALGSITSFSPKVGWIKDAYNGELTKDSTGKLSRAEVWNKFIMTPILDNYAEARRQEREA